MGDCASAFIYLRKWKLLIYTKSEQIPAFIQEYANIQQKYAKALHEFLRSSEIQQIICKLYINTYVKCLLK